MSKYINTVGFDEIHPGDMCMDTYDHVILKIETTKIVVPGGGCTLINAVSRESGRHLFYNPLNQVKVTLWVLKEVRRQREQRYITEHSPTSNN